MPTVVMGNFVSLPTQKKRVFRTQHITAAASPRLTEHGSPSNIESVCSTELRVLATKLDIRKWSMSQGFSWDL